MAENKVAVEITLEEKAALKALTQLTKEIQKTETSFQDAGDTGDKAMGKIESSSISASSSFKSLVGGVTIANLASEAIVGVANGIKNFVLDSVQAAAEQEQATNQLAQALRAAGSYSREAVDDLSAFAGELSLISKYGDDAILSQIAIAKSFGATNQEAKDLVQAAANLAATFGGSLESRVEQLGKTFSGSAGKLSQLIPALKDLSKEQLVAGDAIDIVNKKFAGAAASELDSYAGRLGQLTKAFGEFQEAVGGIILNTGISSLFTTLTEAVQLVNEKMGDSAIESARAAGGFVETSSSVDQLKRKLNELKVEAIDAEQIVNNPSWFDILLARPVAAADNLARLNKEIAATEEIIKKAQGNAPKTNAPAETPTRTVTQEELDKEIEKQKRLLALRQETNAALQQSTLEQAQWELEQSITQAQLTEQQYADELTRILDFENAKIQVKYQAEIDKASLIDDAQARAEAYAKAGVDRELAIEKAKVDGKKKLNDILAANAKDSQNVQLSDQQSFFSKATSLANEQNKSLAAIGIAAGLAQIARDTPPAVSSSYKFGAAIGGPALGAAFGAIAASAQAAQAARLAGMKFAYGGVVPGTSTSGDSVQAFVNSGEMILNRQQQTELFNLANGSGGGNSSVIAELKELRAAIENLQININVDGRKIAESVRTQVQQGFRLA